MRNKIEEWLIYLLNKKRRNIIKLRWEKERLQKQIQQAKERKQRRGEE